MFPATSAKLPWVISQPLGLPVVPEVYTREATSSRRRRGAVPFQLGVRNPHAGSGEAGKIRGYAVVIHPHHVHQAVLEQLGRRQDLGHQGHLSAVLREHPRAPESCRIHSTWLADEVS